MSDFLQQYGGIVKRWCGISLKPLNERFIKSDSIIKDTKTGLEWCVGPDKDTDWYDAEEWVDELRASTGGEWRMPSRKELEGLCEKGDCPPRMVDLVFEITGWFIWSKELRDQHAWRLFCGSGHGHYYFRDIGRDSRAFAVRGGELK